MSWKSRIKHFLHGWDAELVRRCTVNAVILRIVGSSPTLPTILYTIEGITSCFEVAKVHAWVLDEKILINEVR